MRREQDIIVHHVFHPQGIPLLQVPLIPLIAATVEGLEGGSHKRTCRRCGRHWGIIGVLFPPDNVSSGTRRSPIGRPPEAADVDAHERYFFLTTVLTTTNIPVPFFFCSFSTAGHKGMGERYGNGIMSAYGADGAQSSCPLLGFIGLCLTPAQKSSATGVTNGRRYRDGSLYHNTLWAAFKKRWSIGSSGIALQIPVETL